MTNTATSMWAQRMCPTLWWLWAQTRSPENKARAKTRCALSRLKENSHGLRVPAAGLFGNFQQHYAVLRHFGRVGVLHRAEILVIQKVAEFRGGGRADGI